MSDLSPAAIAEGRRRVVTRVEFAIKYAHNGKTEPISTSTAERFLAQGSTRGRVGILMRREAGPDVVGEWLPQDGGSANLCRRCGE